jgi:hypothetical protein
VERVLDIVPLLLPAGLGDLLDVPTGPHMNKVSGVDIVIVQLGKALGLSRIPEGRLFESENKASTR